MEEAFPVLRRLWAGETVDHHGPGGRVSTGVTLAPLPAQDPLEFWTGGMVPAALRAVRPVRRRLAAVVVHAGRGGGRHVT